MDEEEIKIKMDDGVAVSESVWPSGKALGW